MDRIIIIIDDENLESIKKAERLKTKLENECYNLIETLQIGLNKFKMVYER